MVWFSSMGVLSTTDTRLGSVFGSGVRVGSGNMVRSLDNRALYGSHVWVNAGVNLISRAVAKTPIKCYLDGDDVERTRLRSRGKDAHALPALIERPWKGGTQFRLKNAVGLECLLNPAGKAHVWMDREGQPSGLPKRLIPMRHEQITAQWKPDGTVGFYEWREHPGAEAVQILPDDVLTIGFEDGVSPLNALAKTLEIDIASQQTTASFYANGAQVGNVLTTEKQLKPDAVNMLEEQLRSDHKGPDNAFRTLLLANLPGAQFHKGAMSSVDAQTVEHRKLAREEVAAALHIPQPMIGILDRATFSNIETQTRMWVVDTLGEYFAMIESALNGQLIDAHPEWDGCFVEFDPGEILRGAPTQRAETYLKWLNSGTRTPNEMRKLENLPPIADAWADAIYIPANLLPAGLPGGASATPPTAAVMRAQALPAEVVHAPGAPQAPADDSVDGV